MTLRSPVSALFLIALLSLASACSEPDAPSPAAAGGSSGAKGDAGAGSGGAGAAAGGGGNGAGGIAGKVAFESDAPWGPSAVPPSTSGGSGGEWSGGGAGSGSALPSDSPAPDATSGSLVQRVGDRAYALATMRTATPFVATFTVADLADPAAPKVIGRQIVPADVYDEAQSLHVIGNIAIAVIATGRQRPYDGGAQVYLTDQATRLIAFDVGGSGVPTVIGERTIPGDVADALVVGGGLYLVSHENGACVGCTDGNATVLTSLTFDAAMSVRDRIAFANPLNAKGGRAKLPVAHGVGRLYVADQLMPGSTTSRSLQVVSVGAVDGKMVAGPPQPLPGLVETRRRLDEQGDVVRIALRGEQAGQPHQLARFRVVEGQTLTPAGSAEIPEAPTRDLFFGESRAYVLSSTFDGPQTLRVVDLTPAAAPLLGGALVESEGRIVDVRPVGDRALVLVTRGSIFPPAENKLALQMVEATAVATPARLSEIAFGGPPSLYGMATPHIELLPDRGLVVVAHARGEASPNPKAVSCPSVRGETQLFALDGASLQKRGAIEQRGVPLHVSANGARLTAVSPQDLRTVDIASPEAPAAVGAALLRNGTTQTIRAGANGDKLVRLAWNEVANTYAIEVAASADPVAATPAGSVALGTNDGADGVCDGEWGRFAQLFVDGDRVTVAGPANDGYGSSAYPASPQQMRFLTVDVANPAQPALVARTKLSLPRSLSQFGEADLAGLPRSVGEGGALVGSGDPAVRAGGATVYLRQQKLVSGEPPRIVGAKTFAEVFDLANPAAPGHVEIALSTGLGLAELHARGTTVFASHWEPQPNGSVRHFVDRLDVSNPASPQLLAPWNVPGTLLALDEAGTRLVTVRYENEMLAGISLADCHPENPLVGANEPTRFDPELGSCLKTHRTVQLVQIDPQGQASVLDGYTLPGDARLNEVRVTASRVFAAFGASATGARLVSLSLSGATLAPTSTVLSAPGDVAASAWLGGTDGNRVLALHGASPWAAAYTMVDTTSAATPTRTPLSACLQAFSSRIEGDGAVCAVGPEGTQIAAPLP